MLLRALPAVVMAGLIFWSSAGPSRLPQVLSFSAGDKFAHVVAFGVLAALVLHAAGWPRGAAAPVRGAAAGGYGVLDEIHQAFNPLRHGDVLDAGADLLGAALVVAIVLLVRMRRPT